MSNLPTKRGDIIRARDLPMGASKHETLIMFACPRGIKGMETIEAPRSKLRGILDRKEVYHFLIRSLTPQQATGNALAVAVQG